jgi:hypothetical protein
LAGSRKHLAHRCQPRSRHRNLKGPLLKSLAIGAAAWAAAPVDHGPAEASGAAVQVGGPQARGLWAGVVDGYLDAVRVHEAVEEVPGAFACAGDGCRGSGGCDVDAHCVHQVTLVSGSSLPGPVCVVVVPRACGG